MAHARGSNGGTTQAESLASPSRIGQSRLALSFAIAGALSFWLPMLPSISVQAQTSILGTSG